MLWSAIVARQRQHASTMARSSGEERRKCAQQLARGGDQRSPKAAHGSALPALASRNDFARIVSISRATSAIKRAAALPNRATICARPPGLGRDQARDVPASMRDGHASVGRLLRDKRASSSRGGFLSGAAACGGARQSVCDEISAVLI
ncbi:elicitor-inducible LRR receptor-like protein EILP (ISS) [Dorcoceras hygrometricum]|uniref:Elicitor-inducible LRR receptor-like protein EILP (ISS) n=1 Tax=Dorcoceras hygrometricum TaxID=472368 RepID=A0A2Z7AM72_9LAMI|nr:elicitor-inducible LRR receptor-like protein EILP (ISS) [Dorcoceras hygrometricum]